LRKPTSTTSRLPVNSCRQKAGGQIVYLGKTHSFSLDIFAKTVKVPQVEGKAENQTFLEVDTNTVQTSTVPLPQPIPATMLLSNLTEAQKKETLEGYVNYELDYFTNELKVSPANV